MKHNIVIVDDFFDNPYEVRKIALNMQYPKPTMHTYPGKNSHDRYYTEEIHTKMKILTGNPNLRPAEDSSCGMFRLSLEKDTFEQDIHVDDCFDWGGVLFLNLPTQTIPESGTSFWRHNKLNMERMPKTAEEGGVYGFKSSIEIRESIVYGDGLDRSKWTMWASAPMKYNRLVLFDSSLWHSHGTNFGTDLNNGRLVQLFFFKNG